jgi:hypothetical protein
MRNDKTRSTPIAVQKVLGLTQKLFSNDGSRFYEQKYYIPLSQEKHCEFTRCLFAPTKQKRKNVPRPVRIVATKSTQLKIRAKHQIPDEKLKTKKLTKPLLLGVARKCTMIEQKRPVSAFSTVSRSSESKSTVTFKTDTQGEGYDTLIHLVNRSIIERTKEDLEMLIALLKPQSYLNRITDAVLNQMCLVGSILKVPRGTVFASSQQLQDHFFVLLHGYAEIRKIENHGTHSAISFQSASSLYSNNSYASMTGISTHVSFVEKLGSIGALEFQRTPIRKEFGLALESCIIFRIDIGEYYRIQKNVQETNQKTILKHLNGIDLYKDLRKEQKSILAHVQ